MRISEASTKCGLSPDTIRYYERSGIVPAIDRGADGLRRFSPEDIDWLTLLYWLRRTGMPMKEMHRFAELYKQGNTTIPERKSVLLRHADRLKERRAELDRCSAILDHKLAAYEDLEGKTP